MHLALNKNKHQESEYATTFSFLPYGSLSKPLSLYVQVAFLQLRVNYMFIFLKMWICIYLCFKMISGYQATDYTCSQSCAINSEKWQALLFQISFGLARV